MKKRRYIPIANLLLILMLMTIFPILTTIPNANGIRGNPAPPNVYPCSPHGACSYGLNVNGTEYIVKYDAAGPIWGNNTNAIMLNEIKLDQSSRSILVNVTVANDESPLVADASSYLTLWLPRTLIDANNATDNDAPFAVFDNDVPLEYHIGAAYFGIGHVYERTDIADYGEDPVKVRALSIGLEPGIHNIQIVGTAVAPEFGSISMLMLAMGIVATFVMLSRLSRRRVE